MEDSGKKFHCKTCRSKAFTEDEFDLHVKNYDYRHAVDIEHAKFKCKKRCAMCKARGKCGDFFPDRFFPRSIFSPTDFFPDRFSARRRLIAILDNRDKP